MKRLLLIFTLLYTLPSVSQSHSYYVTDVVDTTTASFTAEYQAVLDYATLQAYTLPSAGQQVKQNQIVVGLKTAGKWDSLDVFYVFANDGSEDFAKINWVNPDTLEITYTGTPSFALDTGFTGGATGGTALITGYQPATFLGHFDIDDCSYGFWFFDVGTGSDYLFGDFSLNLLRQNGSTTRLTSASSSSITAPVDGWTSVHRYSFTEFKVNSNGTLSSAISANGASDAAGLSNEIFELLNRANTSSASNATISFFYSGSVLMTNDLYNAINTYMTGL